MISWTMCSELTAGILYAYEVSLMTFELELLVYSFNKSDVPLLRDCSTSSWEGMFEPQLNAICWSSMFTTFV